MFRSAYLHSSYLPVWYHASWLSHFSLGRNSDSPLPFGWRIWVLWITLKRTVFPFYLYLLSWDYRLWNEFNGFSYRRAVRCDSFRFRRTKYTPPILLLSVLVNLLAVFQRTSSLNWNFATPSRRSNLEPQFFPHFSLGYFTLRADDCRYLIYSSPDAALEYMVSYDLLITCRIRSTLICICPRRVVPSPSRKMRSSKGTYHWKSSCLGEPSQVGFTESDSLYTASRQLRLF